MNPLSQLYINKKFHKSASVSICHYHRASFKKSLFIAYLEQESFRGSPGLVSFYCECVVTFYFSLFSYFCCEVYFCCQYLWQSSVVVSKFLSRVSRSGLLQPLVINITGLVQFEKNLSYILSPLASKNYLLQSISVKLNPSIFIFQ